jgi:hypothetical protein
MMAAVTLWCRVAVVGPHGGVLGRRVLEGPGPPDLETVATVARLILTARRRGAAVVLAEVSPRLRELLEMAGLDVEMEGQTELGKQALGVQGMQEEAHLGDLPP